MVGDEIENEQSHHQSHENTNEHSILLATATIVSTITYIDIVQVGMMAYLVPDTTTTTTITFVE